MEWYSGSNMEDLAVPRDEEMFDDLPSPDSWSSWGKIVGNFNSPKKLNVLGVEEFLLNDTLFSSDVDRLSAQSSRQGFRPKRAYHHEHSDAQLNDLSIIDEADDIFFRSIFEADDSSVDRADYSANFTQTSSKDGAMTIDNVGERDHDQDYADDVENVGHFPSAKEMEFETSISEEYSDVFDDIGEEDMSMEESVLVELQTLTVQLAQKTRDCFRDSLYRLAENSRHQTKCVQNGKEDPENSRLQESRAKNSDSDTNSIDRTIATLLFNTMNSCNFAAASASGRSAEKAEREYQANNHFYMSDSYSSSFPEGDAEVPTGSTNHAPHFSVSSMMRS